MCWSAIRTSDRQWSKTHERSAACLTLATSRRHYSMEQDAFGLFALLNRVIRRCHRLWPAAVAGFARKEVPFFIPGSHVARTRAKNTG